MLIDITKDAQQSTARIRLGSRRARMPGYRPTFRARCPATISDAIELINAAERPVILAGHGIMLGRRRPRRCSSSPNARASPSPSRCSASAPSRRRIPLNLGMMGMHGEAWVNQAIQEADLLIALGMRFDDRVTGNLKTYAPNAKKIHVEIDPAEINKNVHVDVAIIGDRPRRARASCCRASSRATARTGWTTIDELKGDSAVRDIQNLPDDGHLYAAHVIHDLWRATRDGNAIVVTDVGQHQMWEAQYYHHERPRSLITSGGLGTMGFALPAAIGAKFARPDAEVWVVVGDGGFQMTMAELATIVQEGINVNIAIINNGYLGMVRQWQEFFYDQRYAATPMISPDFVKLAEAYGHRRPALRQARRRQVRPSQRPRAGQGDRASSISGRAGRHRVPDGAGRRRLSTR